VTAGRLLISSQPGNALAGADVQSAETDEADGNLIIASALTVTTGYVILDGTLIPVDRVARGRPFYSGKHKKHGMNLQVIASPDGSVPRVSGALPGSVCDKKTVSNVA